MLNLIREFLATDPGPETANFGNVEVVIDGFRRRGLYPHIASIEEGVNEPEFVADGTPLLQFGANNYLSLSEHPKVKAAAIREIERCGIGPGGSRLVSGTVDVIQEAERRIAGLTGMEDCLTFPTGYMANVTVFRAVMNPFVGRLPYQTADGAIFVDGYGPRLDHGRMRSLPGARDQVQAQRSGRPREQTRGER